MRTVWLGLVSLVLLVGCGASAPLTATTAETALVQNRDLPDGYTAGPVQSTAGEIFDRAPKGVFTMSAPLMDATGVQRGTVAITNYENPGDRNTAYEVVTSQIGDASPDNIGQQSALAIQPAFGSAISILVWTRCNAVVWVSMGFDTDGSQVRRIAKGIDGRLQGFACQ